MSTVVENCACGCRRSLAEPWHLLAPVCFARLSESVRVELEESCAERPGSPRHLAALKAAICEARRKGVHYGFGC